MFYFLWEMWYYYNIGYLISFSFYTVHSIMFYMVYLNMY